MLPNVLIPIGAGTLQADMKQLIYHVYLNDTGVAEREERLFTSLEGV